jgi:phosphoglycerate dehydrogenase-like enzyme
MVWRQLHTSIVVIFMANAITETLYVTNADLLSSTTKLVNMVNKSRGTLISICNLAHFLQRGKAKEMHTFSLCVFYGNPAQTMHSDGSLNRVSRPILSSCECMLCTSVFPVPPTSTATLVTLNA